MRFQLNHFCLTSVYVSAVGISFRSIPCTGALGHWGTEARKSAQNGETGLLLLVLLPFATVEPLPNILPILPSQMA